MALYAVCSLCASRFCLVRSPEVCITFHRPRSDAKGLAQPPVDRMVRRAAVTK